jgi:asparagine synthetase B (glutamine-hydrolysing)
MDVDRIHTRNLGRDDRVISSHGKEARYPFLSMTLLSYLSSVPVRLKVDPRVIGRDPNNEETELHTEGDSLIIQGLPGDKLLHRLAARKLGLWGAAGRAKRAMQFGSRSARMEGGELGKKSRSGTDPA